MPDVFEAYNDLEEFAEQLQAADAAERRVAVIELANSGDPAAVTLLDTVTTDPDPHVRRGAVSALSVSNMKTAGEAIVHALADQDWMVREVAAETLGICKAGVQAADALIKVLSDEFWQVRLKGVRSLGTLKVNRAVAAIGAGLNHPQANLRKECAAALGEI